MDDASSGVDGFRAELRAWLDQHWTGDHHRLLGDSLGEDDVAFAAHRQWNAELFDAGWAAPAWPARFGGRDAGLAQQLAFNEEMARAGAARPVNAIGVANI